MEHDPLLMAFEIESDANSIANSMPEGTSTTKQRDSEPGMRRYEEMGQKLPLILGIDGCGITACRSRLSPELLPLYRSASALE